jgi:transcriptional/translational regulatory protein YebC/TACO1
VAGHSHSANIKHKKAATDSNRAKLWTELSKAIIVAAGLGGGDPSGNARPAKRSTDAKARSMRERQHRLSELKKGLVSSKAVPWKRCYTRATDPMPWL